MAKKIHVVGVKRREIDEEKLALAFLLLARTLHDLSRSDDKDAEADKKADGKAA